MPFCPLCRCEYLPGVTFCADCQVELVKALPVEEEVEVEDDEGQYRDWVPLARLTATPLAEMLLEGLRAKDIPAVLRSNAGYFGQIGSMGVSSYQSVGGTYVMLVPREYVNDAEREAEVILGDEWEKVKITS